jgi:carotenoid cleavage dioxygenase
VWTVAGDRGSAIYRHDLGTGDRTAHEVGAGRPGAVTFVPDPARRHREDGGWLVGFVHDENRHEAELIVLDAAAIERSPVVTVRIPRHIPYGLHGTWIPATEP